MSGEDSEPSSHEDRLTPVPDQTAAGTGRLVVPTVGQEGAVSAAAVILVTGAMAAGKSTVSQLLAESFRRAVHVRGDVFRRFIVAGREEPTPAMTAAAHDQLMLRYRLAARAADAYALAGFVAVVQDVVIGPVLTDVLALIETRPRYLVVLDPEPETIARREQGRGKTGYVMGWDPATMVADLRETTPRVGLWLDTTAQDPAGTVQEIIDRIDEARVGGAPTR